MENNFLLNNDVVKKTIFFYWNFCAFSL